MFYTILQYFEMECNCARKITEGLFREYSEICQHKYKSPMTVSKVLHIRIGRRPPKLWGHRLQPVQPKCKSSTAHNWDYLKLSMNIECNLIWHVLTADTCPLQFPRSVMFACSWSSNFLFALSIQVIFKRVVLEIKILF